MIPGIQLNELLKRALPIVSKKTTDRALSIALQDPYLTLDGNGATHWKDEDAAAIGLVAADGLIRTPFEHFRFSVAVQDAAHMGELCGYIERQPRKLSIVTFFRVRRTGGFELGKTFTSGTFEPADNGGVSYDFRVWNTRSGEEITHYFDERDPRHKMKAEPFKEEGELTEFASKLKVTTEREARKELVTQAAPLIQQARQEIVKINSRLSEIDERRRAYVELLEAHGEIKLAAQMLKTPGYEAKAGADDAMFNTTQAYYGILTGFCYTYLAPYNFSARVTPNKDGKSTEWLKAREHYTVIHRHHAANQRGLAEGTTVSGTQKNIQRIAHSRRAHTRLLSSAKWIHKKGQRVPVKSSWVGPKEWKDEGGHQTYRIVPR